ncbi:hypothetical protein NUW54_g5644 [Trametes sanguinea]|uniref:Uncharacterized protein n=1 Tax=Trametes sanguinea TaxID=158606 RepID=A0ACC1PUI6_9APHY|nr:hypothetical protein NUW54_g5644 [Trametes sanguinea]
MSNLRRHAHRDRHARQNRVALPVPERVVHRGREQREAKDVLTKAFGEDGAQKREKLPALQSAFQHEWEEGGTAWRDVHAFLDTL